MAVFSNGSGFVLPMAMGDLTAQEAADALRVLGIDAPVLDALAAPTAPAVKPSGGALLRTAVANPAAVRDQKTICADAAAAAARGNPAAPGLLAECARLRAENVAAGRLVVDGAPLDAALRGHLIDAGRRMITSTPALASLAKTIPEERGFAMGVAVRAATNAQAAEAGYAARLRATLSPFDAAGFDKAMALGNTTNMVNPDEDGKILGLPAPVAIGAGVGLLGVAALLAYKFLR